MIFWCTVLMILGFYGILQEMGFTMDLGTSYRLSTWILLLIVLGMFVHIRNKEKIGEKERLRSEIEELKRALRARRQ